MDRECASILQTCIDSLRNGAMIIICSLLRCVHRDKIGLMALHPIVQNASWLAVRIQIGLLFASDCRDILRHVALEKQLQFVRRLVLHQPFHHLRMPKLFEQWIELICGLLDTWSSFIGSGLLLIDRLQDFGRVTLLLHLDGSVHLISQNVCLRWLWMVLTHNVLSMQLWHCIGSKRGSPDQDIFFILAVSRSSLRVSVTFDRSSRFWVRLENRQLL